MEKIKVLGKSERKGVSKKTNKPFHMTIVHHLDTNAFVTGLSAEQLALPADKYPLDSIEVNAIYEVVYDRHGWIKSFEKIDD